MLASQFPEDGFSALMRRIKDLERQVREMAAAKRLESSTIGAGGLIVASEGAVRSDDFEAGVSGWRLVKDSAEFNNLTLRGGIIGNDALANPVKTAMGNNGLIGFGLETGPAQEIVGVEIAVPEGFTQVILHMQCQFSVLNTSGAFDYAYAGMGSNIGASSSEMYCGIEAGASGYTASGFAAQVANLETDSIHVSADLRSGTAAWPTTTANSAIIYGMALFLR